MIIYHYLYCTDEETDIMTKIMITELVIPTSICVFNHKLFNSALEYTRTITYHNLMLLLSKMLGYHFYFITK